jgi:DNA-binding response OmpR family regulator
VSADGQETRIQAGLQAGFYRYLTKPHKLTDLLDAIDGSLSFTSKKSESSRPFFIALWGTLVTF